MCETTSVDLHTSYNNFGLIWTFLKEVQCAWNNTRVEIDFNSMKVQNVKEWTNLHSFQLYTIHISIKYMQQIV